ncbi:MAG: PEP-CTERM system histidine kinase PrsK [Rhodobacterales bacterium]|nr:PEP-CTERM system histidine kinase PrsK [Rhodobacterales bacterium]
MDVQVEVVSYGICAAAYLMMTVLVVLSRSRNRYKAMLAVAGGLSVAWAGSVLALPMNTASFGASTVLEVLRAAGWMILLGELLRAGEETRAQRLKLAAVAAFGTSCVMIVVGAELAPLSLASSDYLWIAGRVSGAARLMLAVLGLLLIENLFRNSDEDRRWSVKHLCFGVGGIMAYDFFLYSDAVLFYRIDQTLFQARGIVNALAVPLILISATRSRTWELNLNVSRNVVFHSAALLGSGFYLLLMSVAGFYLRKFGGDWGVIFQILFLSGALLILVVIFSSSSMRAQARVWIAKHFFTLTYDYREEWLRFTQTISEGERHMSLHDRIIRAVANILDNTSGGLWVLRAEDRAFLPTAAWNMVGHLPGQKFPALRADHPLARFMQESHWIVDMDAVRAGEGRYKDLEVPGWLREHEKAGLIVPLIHQNGLRAFLVLGLPRAQRNLDWETYDLLKTVGTQAASYLAEEEAANALSDARRLEEFSRRSAFIVHDIKNVVSQMSLMVQNAEKYGDNPEFQKDMLATVGNSVERMTDLLA